MGLDFKHCGAHWSYSGFMRFRTRLGKKIGINLDDMCGFGGSKPWDEVIDGIKPLLDHSDCEGELSSDECREVAPRLRELVADWSDDDYDKRHAIFLAEGMELAAQANKSLEFY